jgi:hypothetical protein
MFYYPMTENRQYRLAKILLMYTRGIDKLRPGIWLLASTEWPYGCLPYRIDLDQATLVLDRPPELQPTPLHPQATA